jgi:acyl-CoA hydrolase
VRVITVDADAAVDHIPDGARIVASPACGAPTTLLASLGQRCSGRGWRLLTGLMFDPSPWIDAVARRDLMWDTWHPTAACADLVADGRIGYVPLRASRLPVHLHRTGVDVALVRLTPPDRHGWCSLGPTGSYAVDAIEQASMVVAELDPRLPRTHGRTAVHVSRLDVVTDSTTPMSEYRSASPDEVSRAIARHLVELLPDRPVLQLGIGRIPEGFVHALADDGIGQLRFVGMGCDAMVPLAERGLLDDDLGRGPAIFTPDLLGTSVLMEFADDNPMVGVHPSSAAHSTVALARFDRLISINSAIEVDLAGQVNAELVTGRRVTGVGGSIDFAEAASLSVGGMRVIALPAARVVERLGPGSAVSVPRSMVDVVVTERGVARLEGLSEGARAEALSDIAEVTSS